MNCVNCGKALTGLHKKFCSRTCIKQYYRTHDVEHKDRSERDIHVIREFGCRFCGKTVYVSDKNDRRKVFCSVTCEKKYWKHPPDRRRRESNRGMGHPMSLNHLKYCERKALM